MLRDVDPRFKLLEAADWSMSSLVVARARKWELKGPSRTKMTFRQANTRRRARRLRWWRVLMLKQGDANRFRRVGAP